MCILFKKKSKYETGSDYDIQLVLTDKGTLCNAMGKNKKKNMISVQVQDMTTGTFTWSLA